MADFELRKNPETGQVFYLGKGDSEWSEVQAQKNPDTGEVFVLGQGDTEWRNLGVYGDQSKPEDTGGFGAEADLTQGVRVPGPDRSAPQRPQMPQLPALGPTVGDEAPAMGQAPQMDAAPSMPQQVQPAPDQIAAIAAMMAPQAPGAVPQAGGIDPNGPRQSGGAVGLAEMLAAGGGAVGFRPNGPIPVDEPQAAPQMPQSPQAAAHAAPAAPQEPARNMPQAGWMEDRLGGSGALVDMLQGKTPQVPQQPQATPQAPAEPDPFAGEGFGALAKRRGQEVVQGAAGVGTSVLKSGAISGESADAREAEEAARVRDTQRADRIADIRGRLATPGLPEQERAFFEQQLADLEIGQNELTDRANAEIVPAQERGGYQKAAALQGWTDKTFGVPPKDDSFWSKLAYGAGSMTAFVLPSMVPGGAVVTAGLGSGAAKTDAFERALEAGATREEARTAAAIGGFLGTTEAIPISRALQRLPEPIQRDILSRMGRFFSRTAKGSIEEAIQEGGMAIGQNLIAKGIYDPEQDILTPEVGESALIGAILGGFLGGGSAALRGPERDTDETSAPRPETGPAPIQPDAPAGPGPRTPDTAPYEAETEQTPTPQDAPAQPAAPVPDDMPDAAQATPAPQPEPADPEDAQGGRYEIIDEAETVDGETRPTGRKVRIDLQTGKVSPVPESGSSPANADADATQSQPPEDRSTVGVEPGPAAGDEGEADPQGRPDPERVFLTHEETLAIETDPKTFQYKGGADTEGVTDRLQGVERFDPIKSGQVIIYETKDGRRIIADGHQRSGLARRMAEKGQKDVGGMAAVVYREADGYSPQEVMVAAALKNIAEGSGTATDAARVMRNSTQTVEEMGLPPKSALVRDADGLRKLSDDAFGMVVNGMGSETHGATVGRVVSDKALHADILKLLGEVNPANAAQAEMIARDAAADSTEQTQDSLFGDMPAEKKTLYKERAKILDGAIKWVRKNKSLFSTLVKQHGTITGAGNNQLDAEANSQNLDDDAKMLAYLQSQANKKGPISDALTASAEALANGESIGNARKQFTDAVRRIIQGGSETGATAPAGGRDVEADGGSVPENGPQVAPAGQTQDLETEATPEGEQSLVPGVAPVSDRDRMEAEMNKPKQGGNAAPSGGRGDLFGDPNERGDLFDDPAPAPKDDAEAEAEARRKADHDAHEAMQVRRRHAEANMTVNKTLPGRQKQGVPMAEIQVGPDPEGGFMMRASGHTPTGGFSGPFRAGYETEAEAEQAARDQIRRMANNRIADKNAAETDRKDARKILEWLGDDAPKTTGKDLIEQGRAKLEPFKSPTDRTKIKFVDLSTTPRGKALADRLAEVEGLEARKAIADAWVVERGQENGLEHFVAFDADGTPLAIGMGQKSSVEMPPALTRAIMDGAVAYATHNHPGGRSFSHNDLNLAAYGPFTMVAVGHNGHRHEMTYTPAGEKLEPGQITRAYQAADRRLKKAVNDAYEAHAMKVRHNDDLPAWNDAYHSIMTLAFARMGLINYTGDAQADLDAAGVNLDDFYDTIEAGAARILGPAGFNVAKERNQGRDTRAGRDGADAGNQGPSGSPAPRPENSDRGGRAETDQVLAPETAPETTGDADFDGMLDDLLGTPDPKSEAKPDETTVAFRDSKPGDKLRDDVYVAARNVKNNSVAKAMAKHLGGSLSLDGPKSAYSAVLVPKPIDPAEAEATLAAALDAYERAKEGRKDTRTEHAKKQIVDHMLMIMAKPTPPKKGGDAPKKATNADPLEAAREAHQEADDEYRREFERHQQVRDDYHAQKPEVGDKEFFASKARFDAAMEKVDAALAALEKAERKAARNNPKRSKSDIAKDLGDLFGEDTGNAVTRTDTAAFKRWFGGSKVVDDSGTPLVVYHGTAAQTVDAFKPSDRGNFGPGAYFAGKRAEAAAYGENVIPVYLSIQNPWLVDADWDSEGAVSEDFDSPSVEAVLDLPNGRDLLEAAKAGDGMYGIALQQQLRRMGHDGVIATYPDGSMEYVPFSPEQVKSVNNRGTFDPSDSHILREADGPLSQDKYAKAVPLFREALDGVDMGAMSRREVFTAMARPLVGAGLDRAALVKMKPYFDKFLEDVDNGLLALDGGDNATGGRTDLERDSGDAGATDDLGGSDVSPAGANDGRGTAGGTGASGGRGGRSAGGSRVPAGDAAGLGGRGDQGLSGQDGAESGTAADRDGAGSRDAGQQGLPDDKQPDQETTRYATDRADLSDRQAAQAKADKRRVTFNDEQNIRDTLPLLMPEQQDDVVVIERRFAKPDGHGMLITNGTGTGKTYSGGGVIKRMVQAGKDNILIVAPDDGIMNAWVAMGDDLGIPITKLRDTKDAGQGVVVTTYANMGVNNALAARDWDMVVTDEAHKLSQNANGDSTKALDTLRAITNRPADLSRRSHMLHADEWEAVKNEKDEDKRAAGFARLRDQQDADVAKFQKQPRAKVLFLSATPFSYDKTLDYAEGYLFNYPSGGTTDNGSRQDGRAFFFVENFGYRIRYHKLTRPEGAVDNSVFEREMHERLKREGALAGRSLTVSTDYDRKFVATESKVGNAIDAAFEFLWKNRPKGKDTKSQAAARGYDDLQKAINSNFKHHHRMQLLEAIKAEAAVKDIRQHIKMGRKVVLFHDFNKGGGQNPFKVAHLLQTDEARAAYAEFMAANPVIANTEFGKMRSPLQTMRAEFGDQAAFYNGTEKKADRKAAIERFNDDTSKTKLIVVQADAGSAGISLHDTTGNHQRVLINLGMPPKPTTALQEEGRIRRVGVQTNAAFRYYTIGTTWERQAFADKIAGRSGTVENLALGNEARAIRDGFIDAYAEAAANPPSETDGQGGMERDRVDHKTTPYDKAKTHYFGRMKTTGKRDQRKGLDFYATPEPLGFKMVEWAGMRANEKSLEPSVGDGSIGRYFPEHVEATIVDPSTELLSKARLRVAGARAENTTFEDHHIVNKYDTVVMNPPFGSGGKMAYEHLQKAFGHVRPGGRVVALVPTGPAADKRFAKMLDDGGLDLTEWNFTADISLPTVTFEKAGTSVSARVMIFDRVMKPEAMTPTKHINLHGAQNINEFFERLEDIGVPPRVEAMGEAGAIADAEGDTETTPQPGDKLRAVEGVPTFKTAQTTHAKKGIDLFVATADAKMSRETYLAVNAAAKNNGGYYSKFSRNGAIPGFQFTSEADRTAFLEDVKYLGTADGPSAAEGGDAIAPKREQVEALDHVAPHLRGLDEYEYVAWTPKHFERMGLTDQQIEQIADAYEVFQFASSPEQQEALHQELEAQAAAITKALREAATGEVASLDAARRIAQSEAAYGDLESDLSHQLMASKLMADAYAFSAFEEQMVGIVYERGHSPALVTDASEFDTSYERNNIDLLWEGLGEWAVQENMLRKTVQNFLSEAGVPSPANIATAPRVQEQIAQSLEETLMDPVIARQVMPALQAELDRMNLKRVRLGLDASGKPRQGAFEVNGLGQMDILIGASLNPEKTLHHEAIHALRAMNLFTAEEWAALERAAAKNWVEAHDIPARYPHLMPSEQIEEAIAEEFAARAADRKAPKGPLLVRAFNKIARVLKAIKIAFTGKGYPTPEAVFGDVLAGRVGARDAANTGARLTLEATSKDMALAPRPQTRQGRAHAATRMMGGAAHIPDRRIWEELWHNNTGLFNRLQGAKGALGDRADRARIYIQDRFLPVLRAQQAVERAAGAPLPQSHDAYTAETTFSGKVGRHLFEIDEEYTKPIIDLIAETKGGLDADDVGTFLYARHAKERNAQIASINMNMPDGGSGMSDAEADVIMSDFQAGPHWDRLQKIADKIDQLRDRTLNLRLNAGLISKQEYDLWKNQYQFYVPLKGFAETDHSEAMLDVTGVGRRFNTRGAETKRALGRESEAFNPLQAALTQAQETAIRAEKNRVGQALYRLAKDNPSKALWTVKKPKMVRYYNKTTGMVETRVEDPRSLFMDPNEMAVKIDGKEHRVIFHDERLGRSAGSIGADQMGWFISLMSKASRWFSSVNTMLDPEFVIRNAFRDMTAAQINMRNFGKDDRNALAKAMVKSWPKAWAAAMRGQKGLGDNSEWGKWYTEFEKAGAKVSFWKLEQPEAGRSDMEKRIKLAGGNILQRGSRFVRFSTRDNPVLGFIERVNLAVDNAVRLAAYVEARKQGWSKPEAASLSKNLTVNFNRRGEWGATINALYPFANAGIQGTQVLLRAMTSKRMAKYALGMVTLGTLLDQLNAAWSEEDDDGELAYDKIPDWKNQMNLTVMLGPDSDNAATLWLPYGYNLFPYLGQQASKVMRGVKEPGEALADFAGAMFGAFSPLGGRDFQSTITPTMLDPINEMAMNEDWLGRPIRPESPYNDYGPDAYKFYRGASAASKMMADGLNRATGGTIAESGAIDVSPEYIDHAFGFVTGGAGRFVGRTVDTMGKLLTGDTGAIEERNIPFYRSLQTDTGDWLDRNRYYTFREEVREQLESVDLYKEAGRKVPDHIRRALRLEDSLKAAEKVLREQRKILRTLDDNDKMPAELKRERRDRIEAAQTRQMLVFNKRYVQVMGKQGE